MSVASGFVGGFRMASVLLAGVLVVLFVASAGATVAAPTSGLPHVVEGELLSAFPWIGFNVTAKTIAVEVAYPDQAFHDVIVMIGDENATEPAEWYVVHFGATVFAVDHQGTSLNVTNGTFDRTVGAGGDCIVVAGEQWERTGHERRVKARIPAEAASLADAWGAGDQCYKDVEAPAVAPPAKKTPLGFVVPTVGLIAVAMMRRQ